MSRLLYQPSPAASEKAYVKSMQQYEELYNKSLTEGDAFWGECARTLVDWQRPFSIVSSGGLEHGDVAWFPDGELNVSFNCIDRHAHADPNKVAIIFEGDTPDVVRHITYGELLRSVCRLAHVLRDEGLTKGDTVGIYMPHIPEAAIAMLACARLGLPHSVIFGGFSAEALRSRLIDTGCKVVITADEGKRAGKRVPLKKTVDEAVEECPLVRRVVVFMHTGSNISMNPARDVYWHDAVVNKRPYIPPVACSAEDPLFLLYTSGSTGKPKGLMHTTGGYLVHAALSFKHIFDYHPGDIYYCTADVGWITGHSYVVYGPLCNGATTLMFEGVPMYPDAGRLWEIVERHRVTQLYTAPTAIRALKKHGDSYVTKYDRSSLRILGTVGEPINPEAWLWYYNVVGEGRCSVVDTFWQTETGGIMVCPLPGATPTKPGSASLPFWGVEPVILDPVSGKLLEGNDVSGVLGFARPWPGMARTIFGDHSRYLETYMMPYRGYYFTGDGADRDEHGYIWVRGRVDDVINVSGHRLGTAEIESALVAGGTCAEAAVVGAPDELTGQAIYCFCILKDGFEGTDALAATLKQQVRQHIGPIATPKRIYFVPGLPKTRSGKIMRRVLRKIAADESDQLGDTSTLADPSIVDILIKMVEAPN